MKNDTKKNELSSVSLNSYEEYTEGTKLAVFYMDKSHTNIGSLGYTLNDFLLEKVIVKVIFTQGTSKDHDSYHVFYKE